MSDCSVSCEMPPLYRFFCAHDSTEESSCQALGNQEITIYVICQVIHLELRCELDQTTL